MNESESHEPEASPAQTALVDRLERFIAELVSETNGLTLENTLELAELSPRAEDDGEMGAAIRDFHDLLRRFRTDQAKIEELFAHPFSKALYAFLRSFPLPYRDEHTHLTGSLDAGFIAPRLIELLTGPDRKVYEKKIAEVYGPESLPISSIADVDRLIRLREGERFDTYLRILYLAKLVLTTREAHRAAAYHMAETLYRRFNVGSIRLKFTLFRSTTDSAEQIPGIDDLTPDDVVLGLYEGFTDFQREAKEFTFILAPSFRKESGFYDAVNFSSKRAHFDAQVSEIVDLLRRHPELSDVVTEIDTVGNERGFYRKVHFQEMRIGIRKLQAYGFSARSHHGETWDTLRQGIQAVDNAMNIWHVDAIEHGLSLGINPNHYFHRMMQRVLRLNRQETPVPLGSTDASELADLSWNGRDEIGEKLMRGVRLDAVEELLFTKAKFHQARELEHYQHDVINRMINKGVGLIALPSSNRKLTGAVENEKDHPFSWWEKKGLRLGVGTDNYVTLNTDYIREMLILLYTDPLELKITKLLMVTTGETRRPYLSHLLWQIRKRNTNR